ncbi:hypothetical protein SNOG_09079 [Parastagonospora nodorum SN15]|uniref:Uncharacterized protein n=1 Tax=Phaeosphaeria nodorum (strain SN15 / ATCC MYA-4574 / FGSC 10173) TaxID=321614 RepID=Q0UGN5_PHANO|nr:hypothetical protein SNOG_09079 [Parastagonospora nodorum SN15]EAT83271.1 hypothetical protein SNOG_09079 [Parastagonospora nodorum SN15]
MTPANMLPICPMAVKMAMYIVPLYKLDSKKP